MTSDKTYQFLAQLRPASTSPELLFSPKVGDQVLGMQLIVSNVSAATRQFSIFFDHDGTTADETTALAWEVNLSIGTTQVIDIILPLRDSNGSVYVQSDIVGGLNFTFNGQR